jgi:hypothetical protein
VLVNHWVLGAIDHSPLLPSHLIHRLSRDVTSAHRKALQEAINWYYVRYLVYYKTLRKEKKTERRVSREVKGGRPVLLARASARSCGSLT